MQSRVAVMRKSKGCMRTGKVIEERLVSPLFTLNPPISPSLSSYHLELRERQDVRREKVCSLDHTPRPGMTEEAVDHHQNNSC